MELIKLLPVSGYSVDIISYSGPSVLFGSDGKQNTAYTGAKGHESCCTFRLLS